MVHSQNSVHVPSLTSRYCHVISDEIQITCNNHRCKKRFYVVYFSTFFTFLTFLTYFFYFLHVLKRNKQLSYGRETARSLIHFRLTSSAIRKIMPKIAFLATLGASGTILALYPKVSTQRNVVAKFHHELHRRQRLMVF